MYPQIIATKGVIKYRGRVASLLEVGTGFHFELTGRENIYLNGAINGMKKKEIYLRSQHLRKNRGLLKIHQKN